MSKIYGKLLIGYEVGLNILLWLRGKFFFCGFVIGV